MLFVVGRLKLGDFLPKLGEIFCSHCFEAKTISNFYFPQFKKPLSLLQRGLKLMPLRAWEISFWHFY